MFGYKGRQVRDNIRSGNIISPIDGFYSAQNGGGKVCNICGSRPVNCSMLEANELGEKTTAWDVARRKTGWGSHLVSVGIVEV